MLFSSNDIEALVDIVNINEKPLSTASKQYYLFDSVDHKNIINKTVSNIQINSFQSNLKANVISSEIVQNGNGSVTIKHILKKLIPINRLWSMR